MILRRNRAVWTVRLSLLTGLLLSGCVNKELGKNYVSWSPSLVIAGDTLRTPEVDSYLAQLSASVMESLSDQMRRQSTRDLDKIVWVAFRIDATGVVSDVQVVRNDAGSFVAMIATEAVRRARKPPIMSEPVREALGSPLMLQAKIEFNRPEN